MAHQVLEEGELARRQIDRTPPARHAPRRGVELQVPDPKDRGSLGGPAPHERAQARQQLGERERLGQVVVGAGVEPRDPVGHRVARRKHEDGAPSTGLAQPPADLEAVDVWQHQVQDDRVVRVLATQPDRVLPPPGHVHRVPLLLEGAFEQAGHLDLVLDHQDPHRHSLGRGDENRMRGSKLELAIQGPSRSNGHGVGSKTITRWCSSGSCRHQSLGSADPPSCPALNRSVVACAVFGWASTMCRVRLQRTTLSSGPGPIQPREQTGHLAETCGRGHGASSLMGPEASPCTRQ
jgi:hypothetical protein